MRGGKKNWIETWKGRSTVAGGCFMDVALMFLCLCVLAWSLDCRRYLNLHGRIKMA